MRLDRLSRLEIKGQSLGEVVIFLGIVTLVIMAMRTYVQRGIQAKTRDLTNVIIGSQQRYTTADDATSSGSTGFSGTTRIETKTGGGVIKRVSERTDSSSRSWSRNKP